VKSNRRNFIRLAGMSGLTLFGANVLQAFGVDGDGDIKYEENLFIGSNIQEENISIIGEYGQWASSLLERELPLFSLRRKKWPNLEIWRDAGKERLIERLAIPDIEGIPKVSVKKQYSYDGLHIEELSWQLPYGHPTEAILLKPLDAKEPLPGILAFHDHGMDKFHGKSKITQINDLRNPMITAHQKEYYSNRAWANEIAKRGYVVLVSDAFGFSSRRVMLENVTSEIREILPGLKSKNSSSLEYIKNYNQWAAQHEHILAKSLFSAGTTWPGVFFAEDQKALDILCAREDVDAHRIGCGGLSGGGLRTNFMAALDSRIKCAVPVGFMTTWNDMVMYKSWTHTWMSFVPLLPRELDFPEIVGLRTPLPTLVLNNTDDPLFTISEMRKADEILKEIYKIADGDEHYECSFHPGPHKFDSTMQAEAFDWFDRWLK